MTGVACWGVERHSRLLHAGRLPHRADVRLLEAPLPVSPPPAERSLGAAPPAGPLLVVQLPGVRPPVAQPRREPRPAERSLGAAPPVGPLLVAQLPGVRPPVAQPRPASLPEGWRPAAPPPAALAPVALPAWKVRVWSLQRLSPTPPG